MIFSDLSEQWGHFLAKTFLCIRGGAGVSYRHACFASSRGGSDILKKDAEELCREMLGKLLNISDYHRIFFYIRCNGEYEYIALRSGFRGRRSGCSRNTGRA